MKDENVSKKRKRWPIVVGVLGALFMCVIVASLMPDKEEAAQATGGEQVASAPKEAATEKPTKTPVPPKAPTPTATPKPISDLTFQELEANRAAMTDAQWDAYYKPLLGLRVQWSGNVIEAKESGSGAELWIDMDAPSLINVQDAYIPIPKEDVLTYNKEQSVTWVGDIKRINDLLGSVSVTFENVTVLP